MEQEQTINVTDRDKRWAGGGGGRGPAQSEDIRVTGFEQAATILDDITALAQRVREDAVGKSGLTQMPWGAMNKRGN